MAVTPANALNVTVQGIVIFDGTATFSGTTTTQYNTLTGGTGNTIVNVAPGTAGWVLTSAGNAAPPVYAAPVFTKIPFTDEAISFAAASQNGYFISAVATATLPAAPAQGDVVTFILDTASILTITANTGQFIRVGKQITLTAGTILSNFIGDAITLRYRTSDTTWIADSVQGTWSVTTS